VDTCTVAVLDVITAFAVPNPNCSSQSRSVFSGLGTLQVALQSESLSLLRIGKFLFRQSFQPSTQVKLNSCFRHVNAVSSQKRNICEYTCGKRGPEFIPLFAEQVQTFDVLRTNSEEFNGNFSSTIGIVIVSAVYPSTHWILPHGGGVEGLRRFATNEGSLTFGSSHTS